MEYSDIKINGVWDANTFARQTLNLDDSGGIRTLNQLLKEATALPLSYGARLFFEPTH